MGRTIGVSTEVYAAIWADRQSGEESEDDILRRRYLGKSPSGQNKGGASAAPTGDGVHDARNGVHFPEGFEIFRKYKGRAYTAIAQGGSWFRVDNSKKYPTLNQMNSDITSNVENVWNGNWKYRAETGNMLSINGLRP